MKEFSPLPVFELFQKFLKIFLARGFVSFQAQQSLNFVGIIHHLLRERNTN